MSNVVIQILENRIPKKKCNIFIIISCGSKKLKKYQIKHVLKFVQNITFRLEERNRGQCCEYLFHIS